MNEITLERLVRLELIDENEKLLDVYDDPNYQSEKLQDIRVYAKLASETQLYSFPEILLSIARDILWFKGDVGVKNASIEQKSFDSLDLASAKDQYKFVQLMVQKTKRKQKRIFFQLLNPAITEKLHTLQNVFVWFNLNQNWLSWSEFGE